jgi:hypothetical protein
MNASLWVSIGGSYLVVGVATVVSGPGRRLMRAARWELRPSSHPLSQRKNLPRWKVVTICFMFCVVGVLLWSLLLWEIAKQAREATPESMREFGRSLRAQGVTKGWLRNRITIEDAEAKHMSDLNLGDDVSESVRRARLEFARSRSIPLTGKPIPFGLLNCQWRELIGSMHEGDELWEYRSPEQFWKNMAGRVGIALVRNGEVVDAITTVLN